MLVKLYGPSPDGARRYRCLPAECIGAVKTQIEDNPDPDHVSTSYAERNNLNVRMHSRRLTRLTNAFSKKVENHGHAMALHFMYYNFVRIHKTLPAMAANVTKRLWEIGDIVDVLEVFENQRAAALKRIVGACCHALSDIPRLCRGMSILEQMLHAHSPIFLTKHICWSSSFC
jgi:hypothetical protein